MSVDAAASACCCGKADPGGIDCPEWLLCAPASLLFSWARSEATVRRYPAGGQYADTLSFTAAGTLMLGQDGIYRGTLQCSARQTWEIESTASGIAFEGDGQCEGNPWGCPNLDCCASRLNATDELVYDEFAIQVMIRCFPAQAGFPTSVSMDFDDGGATVDFTRTQTTVFCPDPASENPQITEGSSSALSVFTQYTNIGGSLPLPRECLPTEFFAQYNFDETVVSTAAQTSDLVCFRRSFLPPYFELVGSCLSNVNGEDVPTNCGDVVTTRRLVQVVSLA